MTEVNGIETPIYVAPSVISYDSEAILKQVGPALTCSDPYAAG
jgi:hypothetical protein